MWRKRQSPFLALSMLLIQAGLKRKFMISTCTRLNSKFSGFHEPPLSKEPVEQEEQVLDTVIDSTQLHFSPKWMNLPSLKS